MTDLVIRGGMVVDGTGAPPAGRRAIAAGRIAAVGEVPSAGRGRSTPRGLVVPGLHRRPHALRRPVHVGSLCHAQHLARRHHHRHRQLRLRHRALPARDRDLIMRTLVKVEGMSLAAMRAGITWGFETFPSISTT